MLKWNPGYIYLLNKKGHPKHGKVTTNFFVWVPDMITVEEKLHALFSDSRYASIREVPPHKNFQRLCKIGLTKNPVYRRVSNIQEDWTSGHTEWFALNWLERCFCRWWMRWYMIRWFLVIVLIFLCLSIIFSSMVT
jgi:hypothetical protein